MIAHRDADLVDRPGNTERRFIVASWLKSFWHSHSAGLIAAHRWHAVMIPELDAIFARPGVRVVVAHDPDANTDVANLFGFACGEPASSPPFVYFVYVKENYRRMGLARGLLAALGVDPLARFEYACKTPDVDAVEREIPRATWNPIGGRFDRDHRLDNSQRRRRRR